MGEAAVLATAILAGAALVAGADTADKIHIRDPFVVVDREKGCYCLLSSCFAPPGERGNDFFAFLGTGAKIYESKDLVNWKTISYCYKTIEDRPQDRLVLLPVYDAGGTTDRSINSTALVEAIAQTDAAVGTRVELVPDLDAAWNWCAAHRAAFGCFVTCGARDPGLPVLAQRLAQMG